MLGGIQDKIQSIGDIVTEKQRTLPAINLLAHDKDRQEAAASCQEQSGGDTHLRSCRSIHSRSDQLSRTNVTTVTAASSENNSAISRNALAVNACARGSREWPPRSCPTAWSPACGQRQWDRAGYE